MTDVYGNVAWSNYHSLQLTLDQRRWRGAHRERQLHVQPHRGQPRGAHRLRLRPRLGGRRQRSTPRRQRHRRLRSALRRRGPSGQQQRVRPGAGERLAGFRASRSTARGVRSARSGAACNLPNAGTCYADYNPAFSGDARINGDYGDGDVLGTAPPPTSIARPSMSPPPFTYGNTPRTLAFDLRNPAYVNQDISIRRSFRLGGSWKIGDRHRRVQRLQHGRLQWDSDQHHQRQLRPRQLAAQHAAGRAAQVSDRFLKRSAEAQRLRGAGAQKARRHAIDQFRRAPPVRLRHHLRADAAGPAAAGSGRGSGHAASRRQRSVAAAAVAGRDPAESELLRGRSALQAGRAARLGGAADRGTARSRCRRARCRRGARARELAPAAGGCERCRVQRLSIDGRRCARASQRAADCAAPPTSSTRSPRSTPATPGT